MNMDSSSGKVATKESSETQTAAHNSRSKNTATITTQSGLDLQVETLARQGQLEVSLHAPAGKRCVLHWGVRRQMQQDWAAPPQSVWPPDTQPMGVTAVQTPFAKQNGQLGIDIRMDLAADYASLDFVIFFPDEKRWDNNGGRNYQVALTKSKPTTDPQAVLRARLGEEELLFERAFDLGNQAKLAVAVVRTEQQYRFEALTNLGGPLLLHWGIARRSPREWLLPPESMRNHVTTGFDDHAVQTPFETQEGFNALALAVAESDAPLGLNFVLKQNTPEGRWLKHRGGNFYVPIHQAATQAGGQGLGELAGLADEIIQAETGHNSWTLMHRFNLCYDLLDRVQHSVEGQALLYVWLRFSAIRQLTWQRNYNTQPRELAHAQDRLTQKLANVFRSEPETRPLVRLALATVGRGGDGQRVRDEILHIMHRHNIKEVTGHFLEEWHQKLHNNTTPDDVVICEAYLEFLYSNGNRDRFYQTLENGGVTKQRLESFERPIRTEPQFAGHLKDALIPDFQNFLRVLKSVHSGTDFETAVNAARGQLDGDLQGLLHYLGEHRNDPPEGVVNLVNQITDARRRLSNRLNQDGGLRELLYLDLALEQLLRVSVERHVHLRFNGDQLVDLIARALENVTLTYEDPELAACARHWERLQGLPRFNADWALHAKSVGDRIARALTTWIDRFYQLLQPKAEYLGAGFQAEPWTITLFSEEVVRGSSLGFVVSMLLHRLDPLLRKAANIGAWRIISRGGGGGQIEVVDKLGSIQNQRFDKPTVVVTDKVMGDEELPDGVTAVIAPDVTDIVSHVAVRARNSNVLFASCHDPEMLAHLKSLRGHHVHLTVNPAGDVIVQETEADAPAAAIESVQERISLTPRQFTKYAITHEEFREELVGGKSCHQAELRGKLSDWIHLPASAAIPFGVFEKVLGLPANQELARRCQELTRQAETGNTEALADLRRTVLQLTAPDELPDTLRQGMTKAGLDWPADWDKTWRCIKQVWASKWNDRAFLSRKKLGISHDQLFMAVLIQSVVPADYAFVVHTVNPSTGNANELFAEIVLGLGETLVGNYPGRALSFVVDKTSGAQTLLSYPGKSIGLYGSGLIFRSDSNGEDLAGFAGAGLYESVLLQPPRVVELDYTEEPLVWDERFRQDLLQTIAKIGLEVEKAFGAPQDIEGAVARGKYFVVQTRPQVGLESTTGSKG